MSELKHSRLRAHFKNEVLSEVCAGTELEPFIREAQKSAPILYTLLEQLHRFYPLTLKTSDGEVNSPTWFVVKEVEAQVQEEGMSSFTRNELLEILMPILPLYFEYLIYGRKGLCDKMPTKWDCTEESLASWSSRYGVWLGHVAHIESFEPSVMCDYEKGLLVARVALGLDAPEASPVARQLKAAIPVTPYPGYSVTMRRFIDKAAVIHCGVKAVCDGLTNYVGVCFKQQGQCFIERVIEQSINRWWTALEEHNIPIAYREFMEAVLRSFDDLLLARVSGWSEDGEGHLWTPYKESLSDWIDKNELVNIHIKWGHYDLTTFELLQRRILIMRPLLRRVDLTEWGIPLPGDNTVDIVMGSMYG